MSAEQPPNSGSHLLRLDQVVDWLAGSAMPTVLVHRTDAGSAWNIIVNGVQVSRGHTDAAWGQGFYASTIADRRRGEVGVPVVIRLYRPLVITNPIQDMAQVDKLLRQANTEDPRIAVIAAGFDGVIIHYGPEDVWVVAYWDEQVKVISDE